MITNEITTEIISGHYRRSPLVQGELEVPCKVIVNTPPSFNMDVLKKYEDLVQELYVEPKNEEIIGTFVLTVKTTGRVKTARKTIVRVVKWRDQAHPLRKKMK